MKKLFAFSIALLLLFSLSSIALAEETRHKNLLLKRIVIIEDIEDDSSILISVTIKSHLTADFDNGKVVVSIPELGLRAAKNAEIVKGDKDVTRVLLTIPDEVPPGDYYLRIVVSNEDVKRVKHRLITIE